MTDREEFVAGLRHAADFIEAHPDLPLPDHASLSTFWYGATAKAQLAEAARALGKAEKGADDYDFFVKRHFGPVKLAYYGKREAVCERVEVGTRKVERQVPVGEVEYVTEVVDEPVYKFVCPESLLRPEDVAVAQADEISELIGAGGVE